MAFSSSRALAKQSRKISFWLLAHPSLRGVNAGTHGLPDNVKTELNAQGWDTFDFHEMKPGDINGAAAFHNALARAKDAAPERMASVDLYEITDYRNARCFLAEDETCGFAVSSDGERLSLFTAAQGKRRSKVLRALAEEQGAAHLTHYDGYLCYNETKDITMKLIAGLGNVGAKYCFSRHNAGFMLADKTALNNNSAFRENSKLKSLITKFSKNNDEYMVIKPITYMNLSGEAVRAVIDYYKLSPHDIIVIYDDLSLNLGKIRFRNSGSDGGHNGIKSVIQHLGTKDFPRLKIGIGPQPPIPSEAFVLQNFTADELDILKNVLKTAEDAVYYYFENGIEKTQNKYN